MGKIASIARRSFLVGSVAVAGGVAFCIYKYKQPAPNPLLGGLPEGNTALTPYVRIDAQDVTITTPRAEMGQGIHTTLAALVAEELNVVWDSIRVEHGAPCAAYYNRVVMEDCMPFAALDYGHAAEAMSVMAKFMGMQISQEALPVWLTCSTECVLPVLQHALTWRREEDMTLDFYRPAAVARFRGTVVDKQVHALDVQVSAVSVAESNLGRLGVPAMGPDKLIIEGAYDQPYGIANYRATAYRTPAGRPVSYWRSVGNSCNGFFIESFIDELAAQAGADPLQMRLALINHEPSRQVLSAVAAMVDWGQPLPTGRGRGVAFHLSFGVPVAEVSRSR